MADLTALFFDLGIIIIAAAIIAVLARLLKQPLIPAYIISGIILVPLANGLFPGIIMLSAEILEFLELLAEIGIAFLLFTVGLDFKFKRLKEVGAVASIGAIGAFVIVFFLSYIAALALGFLTLEAAYIGLILSFSSTMVVIKLLADKKSLETLQSRIIIGILLMQDILAVLAIAVLNSLDGFTVFGLLGTLLQGMLLLAVAVLLGKYVFPKVFRFAAKNQELLFVTSLSVCFLFALGFQTIGFSIAIGAFIGGIVLANLPYHLEIGSKVKSLKDFFLVLFFVSIGAQFVTFNFMTYFGTLLILLFITLIIKPYVLMVFTSLFGHKKRVAGLVGMNLGQVSEFGIIIAIAGFNNLNHISQDVYSMTIFLALVSITVTSYTIKYDAWFYEKIVRHIPMFSRFRKHMEDLDRIPPEHGQPHIILVGADRTGHGIIATVQELNKPFLVIDFNPDIVRRLRKQGIPCVYGDVGDTELLSQLSLHQVELFISTIPSTPENLLLIKRLREAQSPAHIIMTAIDEHEALDLYEAGAHYVVIPHHLGGEHVSKVLLDHMIDTDKLVARKMEHIKELHLRMKGDSPHHGHLRGKKTG